MTCICNPYAEVQSEAAPNCPIHGIKARGISEWRVGGKIPLNVYEGDTPMFQCHTPEQAARIVGLLNQSCGLTADLQSREEENAALQANAIDIAILKGSVKLIQDSCMSACESRDATITALREGLEKVNEILYENMGLGHCIKAEGRFVELWHKDPMFKGEDVGKKIQEHQTQVHKALVEQANAIRALLSSTAPNKLADTQTGETIEISVPIGGFCCCNMYSEMESETAPNCPIHGIRARKVAAHPTSTKPDSKAADQTQEIERLTTELEAARKALRAYMLVEQTVGGRNPHPVGTNRYVAFELGRKALGLDAAKGKGEKP